MPNRDWLFTWLSMPLSASVNGSGASFFSSVDITVQLVSRLAGDRLLRFAARRCGWALTLENDAGFRDLQLVAERGGALAHPEVRLPLHAELRRVVLLVVVAEVELALAGGHTRHEVLPCTRRVTSHTGRGRRVRRKGTCVSAQVAQGGQLAAGNLLGVLVHHLDAQVERLRHAAQVVADQHARLAHQIHVGQRGAGRRPRHSVVGRQLSTNEAVFLDLLSTIE